MREERRKQQRHPVSLEVVWGATSGKYNARMSDISRSGCYIDTIEQAVPGAIVAFHVHLPTGPWVQLRGEVIHQFPGVGIGLRYHDLTESERVLVEQILRAHGGEAGDGESLTEQSPTSLETGTPSTSPAPSPPSPHSRRVLVAEDDPTIRHLVSFIVKQEGSPVVVARDGREAYQILQTDTDFSAAIFDMMMPHINGLDLVRYLRAEPRLQHIPVGIITAEQDPKLWDDSLAAGASLFLPKPFTTAQLKFMLGVLFRQSETVKA